MTAPLPPLTLDFDTPDEARWRALAEKALAGAPWDKLVGRTADGLAVQPLYRESDFASATDPSGYPGAAPFVRGASATRDSFSPWRIRSFVEAGSAEAANAEILEELTGGASCVELAGAVDFKAALKGVHLDLAPVALSAPTLEAAQALAGVLPADAASPSFNLDPIGERMRRGRLEEGSLEAAARVAADLGARFSDATSLRVDARPVHEAGGSEAQELAVALACGLAYLRALEAVGVAPLDGAKRLLFTVSVGPDVLVEAAKLRALRLSWARLTEACGAAQPARIHAVTSRRMMTRYDAWTNMLRTTAATFAAAIGGAEAITTLPLTDALGAPDAFGRRIARNTQLILMEESRLGHVADPAGGAWFVESLTRELAQAAWARFQAIEAAGGLVAALDQGLIQADAAKARAARQAAFARRKETATGVTDFPLLGERQPGFRPRPPEPASSEGALAPIRWAAPFEALRDRAEAISPRPTVFFATLGPLAEFGARANFTASLLAAGGVASHGAETAHAGVAGMIAFFSHSGLSVAAICGADARYAAEAEEAARALKSAGASWVVLAGRPGEAEAALRSAGVDQFVFAGQDALDALSTIHSALGIRP